MTSNTISGSPNNIYVLPRKPERDHLRNLYKLGEFLLNIGLAEGWVSSNHQAEFQTLLNPAREGQREAIARMVTLISNVFDNGRHRIGHNDYVCYCWLKSELDSFINNELILDT